MKSVDREIIFFLANIGSTYRRGTKSDKEFSAWVVSEAFRLYMKYHLGIDMIPPQG